MSLNISDFSLFFYEKTDFFTPPPPSSWKKSPTPFPANPLSKLRPCEPPPFWKFGRWLKSPSRKGGGRGAHYVNGGFLGKHFQKWLSASGQALFLKVAFKVKNWKKSFSQSNGKLPTVWLQMIWFIFFYLKLLKTSSPRPI